jgi:flagellar motor switch protein FliN/FliY
MADGAITFLQDIEVDVTVEVGRARLSISELSALGYGEIVALSQASGEPMVLLAAGQPFALGELVLMEGGRLGLRVTRMILHGGEVEEVP